MADQVVTEADPIGAAHRAVFYVDALPDVGELAVVDRDEGFHAANVRRIRPGEQIDLGDGAGAMAHCVIEEVGKGRLSARVKSRWSVAPALPAVTVVQALPKSDRSELAIELATEAGADAFVAWQASRCVARWDGQAKVDNGLRRWRAVARSAARQSRRPHIPSVSGVVSTAELVERMRDVTSTLMLVLHESATEPITEMPVAQSDSLMLVVGPEGGIAEDEIAALSEAGAKPVRLGPTVLRTSSAAAVALGALGVLTPRWRL
jgi:16S rRNA (uracil1498-N3)-methyltransferase